jgi:Zn-dependent protease with chaperone function
MPTYRGHFNDGKTAAQHGATIRLGERVLEIDGDDGAPLGRWPYDLIRAAEEVYAGRPARLVCAERPGRLTVEDPALFDVLRERAPGLRRRLSRRRRGRFLGPIAIGLAGLVGVAITVLLVTAAVPSLGLLLLSESMMRAWGQSYVDAMNQSQRACEDTDGRAALDRLMARLVKGAPGTVDYPVVVVNVADVNAFALPGGHIVLLRGLIEYAETPAEVAGVLAHEVGHGIERHPAKGLIQQLGLMVLLSALLGGTDIAAVGGDVVEQAAFSSYSRGLENEADRWALKLLNQAGINTSGLAAFFERLQAEEETEQSLFAAFLSTHPAGETRAARARSNAGADGGPAMSPAEWAALKAICKGLPKPTSARR